ncbi:MAG TPA: tRNA (adenosine(37)-N6)-dimethylallyltransferase MiaA [Bacillota bacterium]|nr:tRNA (adenosine(37)-N6)-dimethylallyltransferase MiaA [Bacillota bacterium]
MPDADRAPETYRTSSLDDLFCRTKEIVRSRPDAVPVITGPTAAGKSSLAMRLALETGGEIVNCDAMQIYRGFDIGSAKPDLEERRQVVHHMLDIRDACDSYSVAKYVEEVTPVLQLLLREKRRPILCGGSVQYISALLDGLLFPDLAVDSDLRASVTLEVETRGLPASWELIAAIDPEAASAIAPADKRRIIRFFELYRQTGMTKTALNELSRSQGAKFRFISFWLDWHPRKALYQKINQRVRTMYDQGLLEETRALMRQYPSYKDCPAFRGIGYREAVQHIEGRITESEAREQTAQSTRRYAKRQQTWLRKRDDLILLLYDTLF